MSAPVQLPPIEYDEAALAELERHAVNVEVARAVRLEPRYQSFATPWPHPGRPERGRWSRGGDTCRRTHDAHRADGADEHEYYGRPGVRPIRASDTGKTILVAGLMPTLAVESWAPPDYGVCGMLHANGIRGDDVEHLDWWAKGQDIWLISDGDADAVGWVTRHLTAAGAASVRLVAATPKRVDLHLADLDVRHRMGTLTELLDEAGPVADVPKASDRKLVVTRASDITMRAARWLWIEEPTGGRLDHFLSGGGEHWLPLGAFSLLGGRESTGKSTFAYGLAAKVTTGELPGEFHGEHRSVVIAATEDDWSHTIVPRLVAAGADLDRVLRVDAEENGVAMSVMLPTDTAALRALCEAEEVALVLLDPLMGAIDRELDSHTHKEMTQALEPVARAAHEAGVAVLGLIHVNKTVGTDLMTRIMGSRAFTAVARVVIMTARELPEFGAEDGTEVCTDRYLIGQAKNNLSAKVRGTRRFEIHSAKVGLDDESNVDIWSSAAHVVGGRPEYIDDIVIEQEARKPPRVTNADRCEKWLAEFLEGKGPVPADEVKVAAKAAGFKRTTLHEARQEVGVVVETIPGGNNKTTWSLGGSSAESPDSADSPDSPESPDSLDSA